VLLGSRTVPSLVAGASHAASTAVTIPTGIARGSYFVLAVCDATKRVAEARENNNVRSRAITIQ
jgi:subtilase family serine protease